MADAPAPVNKVASFKRSMSLQVSNPADQATTPEPEPEVDVAPTPTIAEVDAAFEKELEELQKAQPEEGK
ncbi:hypothetical protein CHLRE_16g664650v5 [Chlamydomonas reinhardtii]|uniref:Uncharacterized protein n=1 Tax=Chlamydomonas reinhardtii TaxID=3055 RepID=A0A2K3CTT6_CHLRE|nr:uncharacterized protein CHLRE_16g664650v5 [Chlamydomonas reinhardtii]PNW71686.1 hypothetical protein CHLRE_16g664650v5 [Chlamydomonas reinhardtii]